ncbi:MAG: hypothetical protein AVDCRST_MAG90-1885, partial [uncultured Microvirga sp.]
DLERGVHRPARVPPRRGLHPPDGVAGAAQVRRAGTRSRAPPCARAPRDDVLDPDRRRAGADRPRSRGRPGRRRRRDRRRDASRAGRRPAAAELHAAGEEDGRAVRNAAHDREQDPPPPADAGAISRALPQEEGEQQGPGDAV